MAKSAVRDVGNDTNATNIAIRKSKNAFLHHWNAPPPAKHESTPPVNMPSPQPTPFSDLMQTFAGAFTQLHLRSASPAPSDECLQSLDALRLNIDEDDGSDGYAYSENSAPVIDCKHFLEVEDTKHRYGTYLLPYYDIWMTSGSPDPFFAWLDEGAGRNVDAPKIFSSRPHCVSRHDLDHAVVHYCTEKEREQYRVLVRDGKLVWANASNHKMDGLVDTGREDRWIFVVDEQGEFFLNKKTKGRFHHSSFTAGRPVRAAGRIIIEMGEIVSIGPNSGHYLTPLHQLLRAIEDFFGHGVEHLSALCARDSFEMDRS